jgi:hypothetical protein
MAIKIIDDGPEIVITRSEHVRLSREYQQVTSFMVDPPTFEDFVRSRAQSRAASVASAAEMLRNQGLDLNSDAPLTACAIPGNGETCESCQ